MVNGLLISIKMSKQTSLTDHSWAKLLRSFRSEIMEFHESEFRWGRSRLFIHELMTMITAKSTYMNSHYISASSILCTTYRADRLNAK